MRQVFQPWSWRYALLLLLCATACAEAHLLALNLTVPSSFQGSDSESYACTVLELPPTPQKLVGVVPLAEQSVVHHILLYGCQTPRLMPGPDGKAVAWECMHHSICDGPAEIIYGWGRNAPHLELPPGVAFSVGAGTAIRYVVAQVHYLGQRPKDDGSGVTLLLKPHAMPYSAGLIAYAAGFSIPPNTPSFKVENECCYQGHQPLTAFAFRVHTHVLGRQVFMTRQAWNHSGVESIASNNPQLPQAFYHIPQQRLLPGDSLKVTCDFDSTGRPTWTAAGSTHNDEMCNLYMMVYAPHPFIVMCNNAGFTVNEQTPGTMPRSASFQLDPAPFWQPPGNPSHPPTALVAAGAPGSSAGGQAAGAQAVAVLKAAGAEAEAQGRRLGDVSGVSLGPDGSVWALYRGSHHWSLTSFHLDNTIVDRTPIPEAVLVQLDPDTGKVVRSLGADQFAMPHMVTVDKDGNLWVTDVGRHQVLKLSPEGQVLMQLGQHMTPGPGPTHFCKPTQVAVARDGSFYVADGYCNSRVMRFSAQGQLLATMAVAQPASGHPSVIHSVMINECRDAVYVASREEAKVFIYDLQLSRLKATVAIPQYGWVWSLLTGPYGSPLALTWSQVQEARLVDLDFPSQSWLLPGVTWPHDIALGAAPVAITGASDRLFALYVAPTCDPASCGPLRRYLLLPQGFQMPPPAALLSPEVATSGPTQLTPPALLHPNASQAADDAAWAHLHLPPGWTGANSTLSQPGLTDKLKAAMAAAKQAATDHLAGHQPAPPPGLEDDAAAGVLLADDPDDLEGEVEGEGVEDLAQFQAEAGGSAGEALAQPAGASRWSAAPGVKVQRVEEFGTVVTGGPDPTDSLGSGFQGLGRVALLAGSAVMMAVVVALLSLKALRRYYTGGEVWTGPPGAQYHQASIDEMLEESAKLEGIEAGGSALADNGRSRGSNSGSVSGRAGPGHAVRSAANGNGVHLTNGNGFQGTSIAMTKSRHPRSGVDNGSVAITAAQPSDSESAALLAPKAKE